MAMFTRILILEGFKYLFLPSRASSFLPMIEKLESFLLLVRPWEALEWGTFMFLLGLHMLYIGNWIGGCLFWTFQALNGPKRIDRGWMYQQASLFGKMGSFWAHYTTQLAVTHGPGPGPGPGPWKIKKHYMLPASSTNITIRERKYPNQSPAGWRRPPTAHVGYFPFQPIDGPAHRIGKIGCQLSTRLFLLSTNWFLMQTL